MSRVYLSPPDVGADDRAALNRAFDSGWIAPLGPEVDAFEGELAAVSGRRQGVALSSGTAALHLGLILAGVQPGDSVAVQSLTFAATANAVKYMGAQPVFIDSEPASWNMDPDLLAAAFDLHDIKAVITVDLYGQCADYARIVAVCEERGAVLIEDAAEAIGATYRGAPAGSFGTMAALSFNGNKIITTSGGGALVTDHEADAVKARFLATQARDPAPHYEHSELGFNYRMSNLLAALGRSQLADLARRVERRRQINSTYRRALGEIPGVEFMPVLDDRSSTFWLTALTIDPDAAGTDRETIRLALESHNIEARPVWKPMHLQPFYSDASAVGGSVSRRLFDLGLCLPSGSNLADADQQRIIEIVAETTAQSSG